MAEAFNSLFKPGLVRSRGPWKNIDDLEITVSEYIDWFNHRRLHGRDRTHVSAPVEYETKHRKPHLAEATAPREFTPPVKPDT